MHIKDMFWIEILIKISNLIYFNSIVDLSDLTPKLYLCR